MSTVNIKWLNNCELCGGKDVSVTGQGCTENNLTDGSSAKCNSCGNSGYIEVIGPEEVEVIWDDHSE